MTAADLVLLLRDLLRRPDEVSASGDRPFLTDAGFAGLHCADREFLFLVDAGEVQHLQEATIAGRQAAYTDWEPITRSRNPYLLLTAHEQMQVVELLNEAPPR